MDYVKVLKRLISIDTTVPPGENYHEAIDYLKPFFEEIGFEAQTVHIPQRHAGGRQGRANLVCRRPNPGKPRLIFYGHVDVVPASGWNAFKPWVEDGKIYGRGAADMKGGIVALLLGLEACKEMPLRYDVSAMITTDEEMNQADQLRYLKKYLEPVSGASVFSLDSSFGSVSIANLGALHMVIKVEGKAVHSGLSHLGENAIEKAVPLMDALLKLKEKVVARKSKIGAFPDTGLSKMEGRLNLNTIEGGLKVNIVPDQCLIAIDRRLIPEENVDDARKEIIDALSAVPGVRWKIEKDFHIPTVPPCDDPIVDELEEIIREVTGDTGKFGEMGSGDLPYVVTNEWGGQEFGLGVIRTECNIHGVNEFAYQKDIEALAEIISRFITVGQTSAHDVPHS
ncbi:MAG: ArgE/DapE family deacylase [Chloroflexi bacterium]|nr:ArgE/DapE family deacylase [Chloroflexota bacterium]